MDKATAQKILKNCAAACDPLNDILLDRSPDLSDADFVELRGSVAHVLAYMFDYLIEPAITQYRDLNPYK